MTAPPDVVAVFVAKAARTFVYGALGIVLPLYLAELGVDAAGIGVAVSATLVGSAALTWAVRRPAERYGARTALLGLAVLAALAAVLLLVARDVRLVVLAAAIGNVAVGTGETGPFLVVEQVVLARGVAAARRTAALSIYNVLGYAAGALGAAVVGTLRAWDGVFGLFLASAIVQGLAYARLGAGPRAEVGPTPAVPRASTPLVRRLAALFALDAFAGGFVLQSLVAYFLHARFGLELATLGGIFFLAQLCTAASLLLAPACVRRFGLLRTMVGSHLISNALLIAIAFASVAWLAVALLLARHLLSQIDVPTRQAYVMTVVEDHEREAAASVTTLARTLAQAVTPTITGWVMQAVALGAPFALGGGLKIVYDLLLWVTFRDVKLKDESA